MILLNHRFQHSKNGSRQKAGNGGTESGTREILVSLTDVAETFARSTQTATDATDSLEREIEEQAAAVRVCATSSAQIADSARLNAEGAEKLRHQSEETLVSVGQGEATMSELKESIDHIKAVHTEMKRVLKVIEQQARQTRLLSINASIEASRFGAAGASFNAVAQEVKALSEKSFEVLRETEAKMELSIEASRQAHLRAEETQQAFDAVKCRALDMTGVVDEMVRAVREQVAGVAHLDENLQTIEQASQRNCNHVRDASNACQSINEYAVQTRSHVEEIGRILEIHTNDTLLKQLLEIAIIFGGLIHELQKERGLSAGFLGSGGTQFHNELRAQRLAVTPLVDKAVRTGVALFNSCRDDRLEVRWEAFREHEAKRHEIHGECDRMKLTPAASTEYYSAWIGSTLDLIATLTHFAITARSVRLISTLVAFLWHKEYCGIERATLNGVCVGKGFTEASFQAWNRILNAQEIYAGLFANNCPNEIRTAFAELGCHPDFAKVNALRESARSVGLGRELPFTAPEWFTAATAKIDELKKLEDRLMLELRASASYA